MRFARVALALGLATSLCVQVIAANSWRTASLGNLEVYTNAKNSEVDPLVRQLQQFCRGVDAYLGVDANELGTVRVFIFASQTEYERFSGQGIAAGHAHSRYYVPTFVTSARPGHYADAVTRQQATFHEMTHLVQHMLHAADRPTPFWYVEGVAEYFSTAELNAGDCAFGGPHLRQIAALRAGGEGKLIPMAKLVDARPTDPKYGVSVYSTGWLATHYWLNHEESNGGPQKLDRYVRLIGAGAPVNEATFISAFGIGYTEMDRKLADYRDKGRYSVSHVRIDAAPSAALTWAELSSDRQEVLLAALRLLYPRKEQTAELAKELARRAPEVLAVRLYLAAGAARARRYEEERQHLIAASALSGCGPRVPAWAAWSIAEQARRDTVAGGFFPDSAVERGRPFARQAFAANPREEVGLEALARLEAGGSKVDPANESLVFQAIESGWVTPETRVAAARLAFRRGDYPYATRLAQALLSDTTPRAVRDDARSLLTQMGSQSAGTN